VRRLFYLVLLILLVLGIVYVYQHRQELGLVSPSAQPASGSDESASTYPTPAPQPVHPASIAWQSVDRTPDGFKVEMPTDIKEIQIPAYNEQGGSEQVDMIYSYPDTDTSFSVAWADNPPVERVNSEVPNRTLDMARDDALARSQTALVTESEASQQGFPARDFSGRNLGGGVFNSRLILARRRLYMLTAAFPSASARRDQDVSRFFDSFSVVPATRAQ